MKAIEIFCASPASTAICLSLDQRNLVRQGSRVLEQSRLLERQGSRNFEPSNMVLDPGRRSKSDRPKRSTDRRRSKSINNNDNLNNIIHNNNNNNNAGELQNVLDEKEQKPRRSRHLSGANALSRFSCSAIDQSAIIPFQHPLPARKPKKSPVILNDHAPSSASSSPGTTEVVVLRVSLHCQGCAGKVRKHIAKMEGVTSFNIDLPKQKVTIVGNVTPVGVLESVSRVKNAEFWPASKV